MKNCEQLASTSDQQPDQQSGLKPVQNSSHWKANGQICGKQTIWKPFTTIYVKPRAGLRGVHWQLGGDQAEPGMIPMENPTEQIWQSYKS